LALKEKQIRAIEAWQQKKIKETYVNVNEDYRDCEYASNWVKK
jgi:peptidyl-prolyl cis-trans isomerase SurA